MDGGARANRGVKSYPPVVAVQGKCHVATPPPIGSSAMRHLNRFAPILLTALAGPAGAQSLPGGFAYLRDIDPAIIQDIRYAGSNNFVGRPLKGYAAPECVVKREV